MATPTPSDARERRAVNTRHDPEPIDLRDTAAGPSSRFA